MLDALELLFSVEISLSHASFFSLLSLGAAVFKKGSQLLGQFVQLLYVKQGKVHHS